ncbi:MAG: HNH/ENDO VII family nuclease, partial [Prevotella sp.]|nr:HNH/ENDO VII family nuclease [Prevotella sp.]
MDNLKFEQADAGNDSGRKGEFKINEVSELKREYIDDFGPDICYIENTSPQALFAQNKSLEKFFSVVGEVKEARGEGLTEDEKAKIKDAHPDWADEIIDALSSWEEYEIYGKAGLRCVEINRRHCLIRDDIDLEQKDAFGRTNMERMEEGLAPLDKNGRPIELHHIVQKSDSPLAELTFDEHHCDGNDTILHDKSK